MIMKCGYVLAGELVGKFWEIENVGEDHYVLNIGGEFFASADNQRQLLDEVAALDGRSR